MQVFVGSYSTKEAEGITLIELNTDSGELKRVSGTEGLDNPSYLTMNSARTRLYVVTETGDRPGNVTSFAVEPASGSLSLQNERSTLGTAACHVILDRDEQFLFVVNYSSGNICLFPVAEDGSVGPMADNVQHTGTGPQTDRQEAAHPHSAIIDPTNEYVTIADLGTDELVQYRINRDAGKLERVRQTAVAPGAGPRHMAYHPNGQLLYVVNELNSTVSVFQVQQNMDLELLQTIRTLPESFTGSSTCAHILVKSCGRFLYASNRGHDSIAVFRISEDGRLELVDIATSGGREPRNFTITPDDRFFLSANQLSDTLVSYWIDQDTGRLLPTGHQIGISKPVCVFVQ
ncbi:lactonase family protein [Paenibacillus nasutitermitis]|nr:lactonase family protein [Paenibacillus nasutitermitis]